MRVSDSFRDFVLDQLADLLGLRHRAMFGGIGLYAGVTFFGILAGVAATARTPRTKLKTSRGRRT